MEACPMCGTEILDPSLGCQACGYGAVSKLRLAGKNGELSIATDIDFGRVLGSKICGDESRFMEDIQFRIRKIDNSWLIKTYPRVKNPVYLNGAELSNDTVLNSGDKISLKGKAAFIDVSVC